MRTNSSGSRPARVSSAFAFALASALWTPASAQTGDAIIVIDMERVREEADLARALRDIEAAERRALRQTLDQMREALEAEEAELTELRDQIDREAFDARVRAFEDRVRLSRRQAQEAAEALQGRFAEAQRAFEGRITPVLDALMRDRGAGVAFGRAAVLSVAPGRDATDDLIRRLDAAAPAETAETLLPATPALSFPTPPRAPPAADE